MNKHQGNAYNRSRKKSEITFKRYSWRFSIFSNNVFSLFVLTLKNRFKCKICTKMHTCRIEFFFFFIQRVVLFNETYYSYSDQFRCQKQNGSLVSKLLQFLKIQSTFFFFFFHGPFALLLTTLYTFIYIINAHSQMQTLNDQWQFLHAIIVVRSR